MPNLILQKCYIIFLIYFKISTNSKKIRKVPRKSLNKNTYIAITRSGFIEKSIF